MPSWKDKLKIWERESELGAQRAEFAAQQIARQFPRFKRLVVAVCLIAAIPAYFITRYAFQQATVWTYSKSQVQAHPSYADAKPVRSEPVVILPVTSNRWAAYTQIFNDNLDLSAT